MSQFFIEYYEYYQLIVFNIGMLNEIYHYLLNSAYLVLRQYLQVCKINDRNIIFTTLVITSVL